MKGDTIRVQIASPKPHVFGKQLIVWCLTLVKTVSKYELPKFHTFMEATSPLTKRLTQQYSIYYVIDPWLVPS